MNKKSLIIACLLIAVLLAPLFGQDQGAKKRDAYTKTFPIERIYSCRYGYMVAYRNSTYDLMELYVSLKNFGTATSKAMIVWGKGPEFPYLSVTWIDGQIDHITIYAIDGYGMYVLHGTDDELKAKFPDDIEIKF
jgi:hypothetical protein